GQARMVQAGTCTLRATYNAGSGGANYSAPAPKTTSITILVGPQFINFFNLPSSASIGSSPIGLSASSSSFEPVSFTSLTTDVCTVSGSNANLLKAGTCTIRASVAAVPNMFNASGPTDRSMTVLPGNQFITFATPADRLMGSAPFAVAPTASS